MRFFALLLTLASWTGAGLAIYKMTGYWDHKGTRYVLWHTYAIIVLLIGPFILNALADIHYALRSYSVTSSTLAHIDAAKAKYDHQNYPHGH